MITTDILKKETAQYHDEIEQKLESNKLFNGTFTQANYYKMLEVNYQFIAVLEPEIKSFLTEADLSFLDQINLNKLELLAKDLTELKLKKTLPQSNELLDNRAQALGALYVIEGSMLGGMVIAKQLKKYSELAETGFNYFGHYGQGIGSIWKSFVAYLNDNIKEEDQQEQVLIGAIRAYQFLIDLAK